MNKKKHIYLLKFFIYVEAILLTFSCSLLISCFKKGSNGNKTEKVRSKLQINSFHTVVIKAADKQLFFNAPGTIDAEKMSLISSKVTDKITEVRIKSGQKILKGDIAILIDSRKAKTLLNEAKAQLNDTQARLKLRKSEFERIKKLYNEKAATLDEFDKARAMYKSAEAEVKRASELLKSAKIQLSYYTVKAPYNGIVIDYYVNPSELAKQGEPLFKLFNPDTMRILVNVPEKYFPTLKVHNTVDIEIPSIKKILKGKITEIRPESNSNSRSFLIKISLPTDEQIFPGMYGIAKIPYKKEKILLIPKKAIIKMGQVEMVDLIKNNQIIRTIIKTGRIFKDNLEVISGLSAGDKIIIHDH